MRAGRGLSFTAFPANIPHMTKHIQRQDTTAEHGREKQYHDKTYNIGSGQR
jgi:hypothetical protein